MGKGARVRVLTVPSGMPRNWATSLCERPLQYASAITSRSCSGSSSSARCTRHDDHSCSARSSGRDPGGAVGHVGRGDRGARGPGRRSRCARPRRATGRPARARACSSARTARRTRRSPGRRPRRGRGRRAGGGQGRARCGHSGGRAPRRRPGHRAPVRSISSPSVSPRGGDAGRLARAGQGSVRAPSCHRIYGFRSVPGLEQTPASTHERRARDELGPCEIDGLRLRRSPASRASRRVLVDAALLRLPHPTATAPGDHRTRAPRAPAARSTTSRPAWAAVAAAARTRARAGAGDVPTA